MDRKPGVRHQHKHNQQHDQDHADCAHDHQPGKGRVRKAAASPFDQIAAHLRSHRPCRQSGIAGSRNSHRRLRRRHVGLKLRYGRGGKLRHAFSADPMRARSCYSNDVNDTEKRGRLSAIPVPSDCHLVNLVDLRIHALGNRRRQWCVGHTRRLTLTVLQHPVQKIHHHLALGRVVEVRGHQQPGEG